MKTLDTTKSDYVNIIEKIPTYADNLKRKQIINKVNIEKLQQELYRYFKNKNN